MEKCKQCKSKLILMSGHVNFLPDDEPYKSGEIIELDIEVDKYIHCHYCKKCDKMIEAWED